MRFSRRFAFLLLAAASFAGLSFAQKQAQAQVVVVGGYGGYYGGYGVVAAPVYSAPVYAAPVYAAPVYTSSYYAAPFYGGYVAPAPIAYGGYYAPYPAVAPLGIAPSNGLEINYKYKNGLWSVDIDD